jgi:hypothetical protein
MRTPPKLTAAEFNARLDADPELQVEADEAGNQYLVPRGRVTAVGMLPVGGLGGGRA